MANEQKSNEWKQVKSDVFVRRGTKAGWIEVEMRHEGKVAKYIMRKVDRFFSENDGIDTIVVE